MLWLLEVALWPAASRYQQHWVMSFFYLVGGGGGVLWMRKFVINRNVTGNLVSTGSYASAPTTSYVNNGAAEQKNGTSSSRLLLRYTAVARREWQSSCWCTSCSSWWTCRCAQAGHCPHPIPPELFFSPPSTTSVNQWLWLLLFYASLPISFGLCSFRLTLLWMTWEALWR